MYKWKTKKKTVATVLLEQTKMALQQLFKTWGKKRLTTPKGTLQRHCLFLYGYQLVEKRVQMDNWKKKRYILDKSKVL